MRDNQDLRMHKMLQGCMHIHGQRNTSNSINLSCARGLWPAPCSGVPLLCDGERAPGKELSSDMGVKAEFGGEEVPATQKVHLEIMTSLHVKQYHSVLACKRWHHTKQSVPAVCEIQHR